VSGWRPRRVAAQASQYAAYAVGGQQQAVADAAQPQLLPIPLVRVRRWPYSARAVAQCWICRSVVIAGPAPDAVQQLQAIEEASDLLGVRMTIGVGLASFHWRTASSMAAPVPASGGLV
jgi:hypothetical protein